MKKNLLWLTILFIAQNANTSWFPWCCGDNDEAVRPSATVRPQPQARRNQIIILPARLQRVDEAVRPRQVPQEAPTAARAYQILVAQPEGLQTHESAESAHQQSDGQIDPVASNSPAARSSTLPITQYGPQTEIEEPLSNQNALNSSRSGDQSSLRSQSTVLNARPFIVHSRSGLDSGEIPALGVHVNDRSRSLPSDVRSDDVLDIRDLHSGLPPRILTYSVESIRARALEFSQNENDGSNIPGFVSSQDSREF
ncbi:MAG TPA: hypothetical protein VLG50_00495 [Candidatus Saccharimonadales bacterium]|nr:hypothetical protein [Candidatus Saccharimonadales bacterium]